MATTRSNGCRSRQRASSACRNARSSTRSGRNRESTFLGGRRVGSVSDGESRWEAEASERRASVSACSSKSPESEWLSRILG